MTRIKKHLHLFKTKKKSNEVRTKTKKKKYCKTTIRKKFVLNSRKTKTKQM